MKVLCCQAEVFSKPRRSCLFDFEYVQLFQQGKKYTLVSGKVIKGGGGSKYNFSCQSKIELLYARKQCLQKSLEKICDFSVLRPEKVVARLGKKSACIMRVKCMQ